MTGIARSLFLKGFPVQVRFFNMLSKYRLPNQQADEKLIKIIRRDFFILLKDIILFLLLNILPLVFAYFVILRYPVILTGEISLPVLILSTSIYYLYMWLFFFFSSINYYLDTWIITNKRIIDINQKALFSRVISEQKLDKVQDVTSETDGFIPTIFSYGDVFIQTAGEKERFHFDDVPNPDGIRDLIIKLSEENKNMNKN